MYEYKYEYINTNELYSKNTFIFQLYGFFQSFNEKVVEGLRKNWNVGKYQTKRTEQHLETPWVYR